MNSIPSSLIYRVYHMFIITSISIRFEFHVMLAFDHVLIFHIIHPQYYIICDVNLYFTMLFASELGLWCVHELQQMRLINIVEISQTFILSELWLFVLW